MAGRHVGSSTDPRVVVVNLVTRHASTLLPSSRVVFVLCPECGSCRRALFWVGGRLACRRCHRRRYQSQTHGHWTRPLVDALEGRRRDRKSTRLNSSHLGISYAVFCLKKKIKQKLVHAIGEQRVFFVDLIATRGLRAGTLDACFGGNRPHGLQ